MALVKYERGVAITPHDSNSQPGLPCRALFVGGAGALAVIDGSGAAVTLTGVVAGTVLPLEVSRVKATGTTATNIVALR